MISLQDPLVVLRNSPCNLRGHNTAVVPRISTYLTKNYIRYRGAVLWNLKDYFNDSYNFKKFYRKAQLISREIKYTSLSAQSVEKMSDFEF